MVLFNRFFLRCNQQILLRCVKDASTVADERKGTFTLCLGLLFPLTNTWDRTDRWVLVSIPKDTGNVGWTKFQKFRKGSRWFRTTVLAPDSPTLYRTTTAPHCSVTSVEMHTRLLKRIVQIASWKKYTNLFYIHSMSSTVSDRQCIHRSFSST